MNQNIHLEHALQAYRMSHTPSRLSWKQHLVNETFSSCELFNLQPEERQSFYKRLTDCKVTITDNIRAKHGHIANFIDIINILIDPNRKNINKLDRCVLYTSDNGERPIGQKAFTDWGGLQVIDMDIKNRKRSEILKGLLFERLKKYNWFFGVAFSSSGKGLHIYTKIQIPVEMEFPKGQNYDKQRLLYLTNFRHKYSYVYLATLFVLNELIDEDGNVATKEDLLRWMDLAMFKPQQGAFIGYDPHPLINTRFFEDFIYVNFDNIEDMGNPDIDWVTYPDLVEVFKRWEWFEEDDKPLNIEVREAKELEFDTHNKCHYRHNERWRLANTLVKLYGLEQGTQYMRMICSDAVPTKEIQADCITAARHEKPIDIWAVTRLNKYHGFDIKLSVDNDEKSIEEIYHLVDEIDNPVNIKESQNVVNIHIKQNEYLSNVRERLMSEFGQISLIEAGAGLGKTEMVKQLAREGHKIMMVMPFTSTIKSKVENDTDWICAYSNKKVDLNSGKNITLTVDKFSRLNLMEVKEAGYDYIFIDESHLLFQSEYRNVMPKAVDKIRNTEVPIILMTGTPIAETVFFDDIVHIKIVKDDTRQKEFRVFLCDKPKDSFLFMCDAMAHDIAENRRIMFPTNKGTIYEKKLHAAVKYFLENKYFVFRDPVVNYYKKSNIGDDFIETINVEKTIADTDILLCSTYLSVGVDILDRFDFNIYFNELWMPQEIEQWSNRLRSHDLFINLYINRQDANGESTGIGNYKKINMKLNDDEMRDVHSILRLCNGMIARNPIEYKYNSLISSIISNNNYIEYNEIENKYYLNETAYKVVMFERKYREYVQQLPVLIKGMIKYGYRYSSKELGTYNGLVDENNVSSVDEIESAIQRAKDEAKTVKTAHVAELLDLITEDRLFIYRDCMNGKYDIKKGKKWEDNVLDHVMVVKDIEVFEKVVPLFLSMNKMFDVEDIKAIFDFCCDDSYNFEEIKRIKLLTNIVYNNKQNRLDLPINLFMNKVNDFMAESPLRKKSEIEQFVVDFVNTYAQKESDDVVKIYLSPITLQTMTDAFNKIFRCLVRVGRKNKEGFCELSRYDLLWTPKDEKVSKINNIVTYMLADFIGEVRIKEITEKEKTETDIKQNDHDDEAEHTDIQ